MKHYKVPAAAICLLCFFSVPATARLNKDGQILTCQSQIICKHQEKCEEMTELEIKFVGHGRIGASDRHVYLFKEHELVEVSELGVSDTLVWEDNHGKNLFFFNSGSFSENPASTFVWAIHRIGPGGDIREDYSGGTIQGTCRWRGV